MKITAKQKAILTAYLHGVLVAFAPLVMIGEHDWKKYGYAVVAGVLLPALRALNKKDSAFGLVADVIEKKIPVTPAS